jgi:hypothetical protein
MKIVRPKRVGISTWSFVTRGARHINLIMEFVNDRITATSIVCVWHGGVLAKITSMIGTDGLQVDVFRLDLGEGGLGEDVVGNVFYYEADDLVDEADIPVLAGGNACHDLAAGDLGINDGFAAPPPIVDHHNEILHPASA